MGPIFASPKLGNHVCGEIEEVTADGRIRGWACQATAGRSISVHVYLNGPAGGGHILGGWLADRPLYVEKSLKVCGDGLPHGFEILVDRHLHIGKSVFVHAISIAPPGLNPLLTNSGKFKVPSPNNNLFEHPRHFVEALSSLAPFPAQAAIDGQWVPFGLPKIF